MASKLIQNHFHSFNARQVKEAVDAWVKFHAAGGKMFVSLGGAMSTAGLGSCLAPMIEAGLIAGISTTGANLEEDYFRAVGLDQYKRIDQVPELTEKDDEEILKSDYSRVYDITIPNKVMKETEDMLLPYIKEAIEKGEKISPHKLFYRLMKDENIVRKDSWLYAAMQMDLHIVVPGWEDSSLANALVGLKRLGKISSYDFIQSGLEQMDVLVDWYQETTAKHPLGFFQVGGGIAGDFPICVVPLIKYDLFEEAMLWQYFCQITDSTPSYGSYSGALPQEKITWYKLAPGTPMFNINSDATIVAPLIFEAVLEKIAKSN